MDQTASGGQCAYSVTVAYDAEADVYYASVPTLGFVTQGNSVEHAFEMAADAIKGRLEAMNAYGIPPPEETHPVQVRVITVKLPS